MTKRDRLIAELKRIYFATERKASMAEEMADAAIRILGK